MKLIVQHFINYFLIVLVLVNSHGLLAGNTSDYRFQNTEQEGVADKPNLKFRNIPGLYSNRVSSLCQDKHGFIWIGTFNGLHRYDGSTLKLYRHDPIDSSSLVHNRIETIFEDSEGNLWIGTANGVSRYSWKYDKFINYRVFGRYPFSADAQANGVMDFAEDKYGVLWMATENEGIYYYDEDLGQFEPFFEESELLSLSSHNFSCMGIGSNGQFWIGTYANGVIVIDPMTKRIETLNTGTRPNLNNNRIADIASVVGGEVWIGTNGGGISVVRESADMNYELVARYESTSSKKGSLTNDEIKDIYQSSDGLIWVCNINGGLHLYNEPIGGFYNYSADTRNRYSISSNSVYSVLEDRDGRLWVGTSLSGIDVHDPEYFVFDHYYASPDHYSGFESNIVRDFAEDDFGRVWVATDGGGISRFDQSNGSFETVNLTDGLTSDAVLSVCKDSKGKFWLGTWAGGINVLDPQTGKIQVFKTEVGELENVFHIMEDREENLWFATYSGGLARLDGESGALTSYRHDPEDSTSIGLDLMHTLYEDNEGNVYIGIRASGLNVLEKDKIEQGIFRRFLPKTGDSLSIPSLHVNQILQDQGGTTWVATDNGLRIFDLEKGRFYPVDAKTELNDKDVRSMIEDKKGNLWIRTIEGLTQYRPADGFVRHYGIKEGVQKGSFMRHTMFQDSRGLIYFAGEKGFNVFHPDSLNRKNHKPRILFTDLKVFNTQTLNAEEGNDPQHISQLDELVFRPEDWKFTIEYVALNLSRAENNEYAYKMEGLEDQWNYVGNEQSATYTHLPPGTYTFWVKAISGDDWNGANTASIQIKVLPDWYETWWAKVMLFGVVLYLILVMVRVRTTRLSRAKKDLELIVARRTLQLREKNAEILKQANELKFKNEELAALNESISEQAEELKTYNDTLNAMNENLEGLVRQRTEKLEKKNDELVRYSFTNAHAVRGPLTRIMGLINLIKGEGKKTSDPLIKKIEEATNEMDQITRTIGQKLESELDDKE